MSVIENILEDMSAFNQGKYNYGPTYRRDIREILEKYIQQEQTNMWLKCIQCGKHYLKEEGLVKFCSAECCEKWNGLK